VDATTRIEKSTKLSDVYAAWDALTQSGKDRPLGEMKYVGYSGDLYVPSGSSVSHIQGYVKYYTNFPDNEGVDCRTFHIFSHSDVSGQKGDLYFISECRQYTFHLRIPVREVTEKEIDPGSSKNRYYNHPGGIQAIGNYLMVPVQASKGLSFSRSFILYCVDLTPLNQQIPTAPVNINEILRSNQIGAMCVGVTDVKCEISPSSNVDEQKYMFAILGSSKDLHIYIIGTSTDFKDIQHHGEVEREQTYTVAEKYQNIGLFSNISGEVFMLGFDRKNYTDSVSLYSLTNFDGTDLKGGNKLMPLRTKKVTTNHDGSNKITFDKGAGFDIPNEDQLFLYATSDKVNTVNKYFPINIFKSHAGNAETILAMEESRG
jgi:hypothetical protein